MKTIILWIDEAGRGPWAGPLSVAGVAVYEENIFTKIPLLNDSKKISEKNRENIFEELKNLENAGEIQIFHIFKSASEIDNLGIRNANFLAMSEIIEQFLEKNYKNLEKEKFFIKIDGSDNFIFDEKIFQKFWKKYDIEYIFAKKKSRKKIEYIWENSDLEKILKKIVKKKLQKEKFLKFLDFHLFQAENFQKYEKLDFSYNDKKCLFQEENHFENIFKNRENFLQILENNFWKNFSEMWRKCEKNVIQFFIGGDASEKEISAASIIAKVERDAYMKSISDNFPEYDFAKNKWYGTRSHHDAILNYGINIEHRKTFEPIKGLISAEKFV